MEARAADFLSPSPNPNNKNKAKNQGVEKTLDQEGINQICCAEQSETISNDHLIKDHNFLYSSHEVINHLVNNDEKKSELPEISLDRPFVNTPTKDPVTIINSVNSNSKENIKQSDNIKENEAGDIVILEPSPRRVLVDLINLPSPTSRNGFFNPNKFSAPKQDMDVVEVEENIICTQTDDEKKAKCPICMEKWSTNGSHRVCTIKCGHLYGLSCLRRWMNQTRKPNKHPSCPICNKPIFKNDIIPLFITEVYALETNELDIFVERLNTTKKERDILKKENAELKRSLVLEKANSSRLTIEVENLKRVIAEFNSKPNIVMKDFYEAAFNSQSSSSSQESSQENKQPVAEISSSPIYVSKHFLGGAVVPPSESGSIIKLPKQAQSNPSKLSIASGPSTKQKSNKKYYQFSFYQNIAVHNSRKSEFLLDENAIVFNCVENVQRGPQHGIIKVSLLDPMVREQLWLHSGDIRDLKSQNGLLLCASFDKTVSVVDNRNFSVALSCKLDAACWSCCWSESNSNLFYVGTRDGTIRLFDIRNAASQLLELSCPQYAKQPCHSLSCLPPVDQKEILLSGCIDSVCVWSVKDQLFSATQLHDDLKGKCISVKADKKSALCVASYRTTKEYTKSSHHVFNVNVNLEGKIENRNLRVLYSDFEQPLLSKSTIFQVNSPKTRALVVANEGQNTTVWDANKGQRLQELPHPDVVDVNQLIKSDSIVKVGKRRRSTENGCDILCTISSSFVRLYHTTNQ